MDQAGQAPLQGRRHRRRGRDGRSGRRRPEQAHLSRHEAGRAQPVDAAAGQVPARLHDPRQDPQHHRVRHLRRDRRGHRRAGPHQRHLVDLPGQAPEPDLPEGGRGRGRRSQHRRRERALLLGHQAAVPRPLGLPASPLPARPRDLGAGHPGRARRRDRRDRAGCRGSAARGRDRQGARGRHREGQGRRPYRCPGRAHGSP